MTDITERLRSLYVQHGTDYVQEAADEIERLRDELSDAKIKLENEKLGAEMIYQENDRLMHDCQRFLNEIERLRAELNDAKVSGLKSEASIIKLCAEFNAVEIKCRKMKKAADHYLERAESAELALRYAAKQVPELATVPGIAAAITNAAPMPPSVPEGWELVPTELGTELYDACERAVRKGYGWHDLDELMKRIDDAYALKPLAAAPKPEATT